MIKTSRHPWLSVLLTAMAALLLSGCSDSAGSVSSQDNQPPAVNVEVEVINPAPLRDVLVLPGSTEAYQDVLLAADVGGRVEWVCSCEGKPVKKGDIVAKVDEATLRAVLDRTAAAFKLADALAKRRQSLFKKKVLPREELDRALTERIVAKGQLVEARVRYSQAMVRSPINGVVNATYVEVGEFVDRGKPVAEIVNINPIRISVSVPEMDVRFLKPGDPALVTVDAFAGRQAMGKVDLVSFKADPVTKTFKVRVVIDNSDRSIRPGMIARVFFQRRIIPDALTVPLYAIVDKGGDRLVFVDVGGVAQARQIKIGIIHSDRVQITEGIKPGDRLIVVGQHDVEQGMRVTAK